MLADPAIPGALGVSLVGALLLTPGAIRAARRLNFYDRPNVHYKRQRTPTPYLGGLAVMAGLVVGAVSFGTATAVYLPVVVGALAFWALGTVDDRIAVRPRYRIAAEIAAGAALWVAGLGWSVFGNPALDLALTAFWVVGLVNAFNLLDNMDGVAASVGSACAAGVAALALANGDLGLAGLAAALAGACLGFLPYNITSPARIYLGDGGSMPLGFAVAALIMAAIAGDHLHVAAPLAGALLAGIPILDTMLVTVSRRRRGVSVMTGGRDHVTHRIRPSLPSDRAVAGLLAAVQLVLCAVAVDAMLLGPAVTIAVSTAALLVATMIVARLEGVSWAVALMESVRPRPPDDQLATAPQLFSGARTAYGGIGLLRAQQPPGGDVDALRDGPLAGRGDGHLSAEAVRPPERH